MGRTNEAIRYDTDYSAKTSLQNVMTSFNVFKYIEPIERMYSKHFISSTTSKVKSIWQKDRPRAIRTEQS